MTNEVNGQILCHEAFLGFLMSLICTRMHMPTCSCQTLIFAPSVLNMLLFLQCSYSLTKIHHRFDSLCTIMHSTLLSCGPWGDGIILSSFIRLASLIGFGTFCSKIRLLCSALMLKNSSYYAPGLESSCFRGM